MPRLTASKEEVKGQSPMPEGLVTIRLDSFEPKFSKDKGSINLNPTLKIINHAEHNDRRVFENLNTKAKWVWKDFCHAFGVPLIIDASGDVEFPGNFDCSNHGEACDGSDPTNWQYRGPLVGQQAQAYLIQSDDTKGGIRNAIKYYVCRVSGCTEKHSQKLNS